MGLDYDFDHERERDEGLRFARGCLFTVAVMAGAALAGVVIWWLW